MSTTKLLKKSLAEDHASKDITSLGFPDQLKVTATITVKQPGVLCGIMVAQQVFQIIDRHLRITSHYQDGAALNGGETIITLSGKVRSILAAERTALNILQHLSGVATQTRAFVSALDNPGIRIRDTRKTLPLLRKLEKYAVKVGGGKSQRYNLADQVLFKDNHWACLEKTGQSIATYIENLRKTLAKGRKLKKGKPVIVQIEAATLEQVEQALTAKPDLILLDNMSPDLAAQACTIIGNAANIELSGGITLSTIKHYRHLPIQYISIGALTHSAPALDMSLRIT